MFKRINWLGPEGFIPNVGTVKLGDTVEVPENKADSYVKQGLAEFTDTVEENIETKLEHTEGVTDDA